MNYNSSWLLIKCVDTLDCILKYLLRMFGFVNEKSKYKTRMYEKVNYRRSFEQNIIAQLLHHELVHSKQIVNVGIKLIHQSKSKVLRLGAGSWYPLRAVSQTWCLVFSINGDCLNGKNSFSECFLFKDMCVRRRKRISVVSGRQNRKHENWTVSGRFR